MSNVMCHMSHFLFKVDEFVVGGSVINGGLPRLVFSMALIQDLFHPYLFVPHSFCNFVVVVEDIPVYPGNHTKLLV